MKICILGTARSGTKAIYKHQLLPLFIQEPENHSEAYLDKIFGGKEDGARVIKIIKGNGRFRLFKRYAGSCKFVFVIRNPLDSVNSLRNHYSYYGGEFHKNDYGRFVKEVKTVYNDSINETDFNSFRSEIFWWYYMNHFALESFQGCVDYPFVICYEDYIMNRGVVIKNLCNYLKIPYKAEYLDVSTAKVGRITTSFNINVL